MPGPQQYVGGMIHRLEVQNFKYALRSPSVALPIDRATRSDIARTARVGPTAVACLIRRRLHPSLAQHELLHRQGDVL